MPSYRAGGHNHVQSEAAATWIINHSLNRSPSITVAINFEGKLQVILPREIEVVSPTQVAVKFTSPQTGTARLS